MKYLFPVEGTVLRAVDREASSLIAGVAAVGASLLTAATIKIVDYFKEQRAQDQQAIDTAKQEIIKGIKAYDEEQEHHDSTE